MNIALFGATGTIGQRILKEALQRGHTVTAVVRDPSRLTTPVGPNLKVLTGDILDAKSVAATVTGQDAVISSYGPPHDGDQLSVITAAHTLIAGLTEANVKRLLVVGGAGSLEIAPGVQLVDTPQFPEAWKGIALAAREALHVYRTEGGELEWTYLSPAAMIQPGERTGKFRVGGDQLLVDAAGNSAISAEDFAIALIDEVEKPAHIRRRFTVAY